MSGFIKYSFRRVLSYSTAPLTSSSSECVLCVCRGWERFRNGRLTTRYPTTVARSAKEQHVHTQDDALCCWGERDENGFILSVTGCYRCSLEDWTRSTSAKQLLTLSNYTVHDAHREPEEDEVMQVVHLEGQSGLHSHIHSSYQELDISPALLDSSFKSKMFASSKFLYMSTY